MSIYARSREYFRHTGSSFKEAHPRRIIFEDFMETEFIPHYRAKNKHFPGAIFNFFISRLGRYALDEITPIDIERALTDATSGLAAGTYNKYLKLVRGAYNYAVETGLTERSPVKCGLKREDNSRARHLNKDEALKLLAELKLNKKRYVWEMVYIALYTGLRYGEIRALRREDARNGFLHVRSETSKSGRGRVIPLTEELSLFFENACFDYSHNIKWLFQKALSKLNIDNFRFHDLRHTFASWLVMSGVDLYAVKELLGHSQITMTQRYAHLSPSYLSGAMKKLFED